MRVFERPQVRYDLNEIVSYIANHNPDAAWNFFLAYDRMMQLVAANPFAGAVRKFDSTDLSDVRLLVVSGFERYNIYYTVSSEHIEIIRVLHSARKSDELM